MDRAGAAALALAATASLALAADTPPLRAARWLATGADPVRALAYAPAECLKRPTGRESAYAVEVGRAAFRSPLLLGGQAARAGLSCESCHRSGRGNPQFHFPGVSGAPGTADVTASLFSTRRGDGVDNPKPIPDLAAPKSSLKIAQDTESHALERFIRGLVVEEFDGREPSPRVLSGLAAYVRANSPSACPPWSTTRDGAAARVDAVRRAIEAAREALRRQDRATAETMILAARSGLGGLNERYASAQLGETRARLRSADQDLAAALDAVRRRDPRASEQLAVWLARQEWIAGVTRDEAASLFEPANLVTPP